MEILGLLDALESMILDGTRIPLTKKVVINEEKVLALVDKLRLVAQGGGGFAQDAIVTGAGEKKLAKENRSQAEAPVKPERPEEQVSHEGRAAMVLEQAYQMAKEIREGADRYADEVLANLEATSSRILRTIKAGRDRLSKAAPEGDRTDVAGEKK